jgi:hypothetical protein
MLCRHLFGNRGQRRPETQGDYRGGSGDNLNPPADVASDGVGNIYAPESFGNTRVAKLDDTGRFLRRGVRAA